MRPEANVWSEDLRQQTKAFIHDMQVSSFDGNLHFKHHDDRFAILTLEDLLSGKLALTEEKSSQAFLFADVDALLNAGWVID